MAARLGFALGALLLLALSACDATEPADGDGQQTVIEGLPAAADLTKNDPVRFIEISGPTFYAVYNPKVVSDDGVLWHSHKNCPGSPPNYAFPVSEPQKLSDGLQRVTMACQYKHN